MPRYHKVWFGTRGHMQWVPAPNVNMPSAPVGWQTMQKFQNGGARVRRSVSASREYTMTWNMVERDEIRPVMDYAAGMYGANKAVYLADPFAMDKNMLNLTWSIPSQSCYDGIILDNSRTRPQIIPTSANQFGYPSESARFTVASPGSKPIYSHYIPIPPGYTGWVGVHGNTGTGGKVVITPSTGETSTGTPVDATLLTVNTPTRVNHSFDSTVCDGIILTLGGVGTITLSGIIVQVLPTGKTPEEGGFISGQGNSGLSFKEVPNYTPYNAALDKVGVVAELVETEAWRFTPNV